MRVRESKPSKTVLLVLGIPGSIPGATATASKGDPLLGSDDIWVPGPVAVPDRGSDPEADPDAAAVLLPLLMRVIGKAQEAAALRAGSADTNSPGADAPRRVSSARGERDGTPGHHAHTKAMTGASCI